MLTRIYQQPLTQLRLMLAQSQHSENAEQELAARAGGIHSGANSLHWIIGAFTKFSKDEGRSFRSSSYPFKDLP